MGGKKWPISGSYGLKGTNIKYELRHTNPLKGHEKERDSKNQRGGGGGGEKELGLQVLWT